MDAVSALILIAVAACLAGGVAALARPGPRVSRVSFALGAFGAAAWLFAIGSVRVSPSASVAALRARAACAAAAAVPLPWTVLLLAYARENGARVVRAWRPYLVLAALAAAFFVAKSLDGSVLFGIAGADDGHVLVFGPAGRAMIVYLIASVLALLFNLEVTLRAARPDAFPRLKHAALGLFAALAYHAFVLSAALLYSRVRVSLLAVGAVPALAAMALIGYSVARRRLAGAAVRVGRPVFYASFTAFAAGAYLLAVGLVGLIVRTLGLSLPTAPLVAVSFLALTALAALLSSTRVRRHMRRFVDSNFHLSRHDYRREWARASRVMASGVDEAEIVESVRALVADALDAAPVEVALVENEARGPLFFGDRAFDARLSDALGDDALLRVLDARRAAVRIGGGERELRAWAGRHAEALERSGHEIAGPLLAGAELVGIVLVGPRRAGGHTSEDLDLLTTIGLQAGNALLAARLATRMAEGRELETLHRVSAFVVHDLKNCITGLSMLLGNARTRLEDPEFRASCLEAIAESIGSMERIVARVGGAQGEQAAAARSGLADAVREAIDGAGLGGPTSPVVVRMSVPEDLAVAAARGDVAIVLRNLLRNAREALDGHGQIDIHAERCGNASVVVRVSDNGPGIPERLIESGALFRPFRTTKEGGLGIGLYHCRELVRSCGGGIRAFNGARGAVFEIVLPQAG